MLWSLIAKTIVARLYNSMVAKTIADSLIAKTIANSKDIWNFIQTSRLGKHMEFLIHCREAGSRCLPAVRYLPAWRKTTWQGSCCAPADGRRRGCGGAREDDGVGLAGGAPGAGRRRGSRRVGVGADGVGDAVRRDGIGAGAPAAGEPAAGRWKPPSTVRRESGGAGEGVGESKRWVSLLHGGVRAQ
jgi:hypothetical protein